jgi:hypothetical protein
MHTYVQVCVDVELVKDPLCLEDFRQRVAAHQSIIPLILPGAFRVAAHVYVYICIHVHVPQRIMHVQATLLLTLHAGGPNPCGYTYTHTYMHVQAALLLTLRVGGPHQCVDKHVYVHLYVCVYVCVCVYIYTVYVYMCVYNIYIYTYIHTYIHAYAGYPIADFAHWWPESMPEMMRFSLFVDLRGEE